jgi:glucose/arabinose dehydrogenase
MPPVNLFCRGLFALAIWTFVPIPSRAEAPNDKRRPDASSRSKANPDKLVDQGKYDSRLKGYFAPQGIKLEIVADHPVVTNPVGMAFADDGTLYVLEWKAIPDRSPIKLIQEVTYKDGTKHAWPILRKVRTDEKGRVVKVFPDVVKVLGDTQGKGVYHKATAILEIEQPSSILFHDGWLYLTSLGTVQRYRQSKGSGPFDVKQVVARGFCPSDTMALSLSLGNNGWLYIASGAGPNWVEGSDGRRATALDGAVFRCRPDGSRIDIHSKGFPIAGSNTAFDAAGNLFVVDGHKKNARPLHLPEASWWPDLATHGPDIPSGLLYYDDTRLPEYFRGVFYHAEPRGQAVRAFQVEPQGAGWTVAGQFEVLKRHNLLFRPFQVVLGPDGAIYVCDWRSDCPSGRLSRFRPNNKHGRIYRLSWVGTGQKDEDGEEDFPALKLRGLDSWAKILKLSGADLVMTLASEDYSCRQRAQAELIRQGDKHRPALLKLLADADSPLRARIAALGALQTLWNDDVAKAFGKLLDDAEPDLRRLAADGLALNCARADQAAHEALLEHLGDSELAVRRAVALAIGRLAAPGAADALVNAFHFDDGKDAALREGLVRAIERLGKDGLDKLLDLANSGEDRARDKVVEAFALMRTRPAAEYVARLLEYPHLTVAQETALVRSLGYYRLDPPLKLDAMVAYLAKHPKTDSRVKLAGIEVLAGAPDSLNKQARDWLFSLLKDATDRHGQRGKQYPVQRAAVMLFGRDKAHAQELGRQLLGRKISLELLPEVVSVLNKYAGTEPEIGRLLREVKQLRP